MSKTNSNIKNLNINHVFFKKNKKVKLMGAALAIGLPVILIVNNFTKDDISNKSLTQCVEMVKDDTCFDEINFGFKHIESMDDFEKYLQLAEKLHDMDFRRIEIDEKSYNDSYKYTIAEITATINKYEEENKDIFNFKSNEVSKLEQILSFQEKQVNGKLYNMYEDLELLTITAAKSKVVDANHTGTNSIRDVEILGSNYGSNDPEAGLYKLASYRGESQKITPNDSEELYDEIEVVYGLQSQKYDATYQEQTSYNKDRINLQYDAINKTKKVIVSKAKLIKEKIFGIFATGKDIVKTSRSH